MRSLIPTDDEILVPFMGGVRGFAEELGPGVSASTGLVLMALWREAGVRMSDLADAAGVSKFACTRAVRTLQSYTMLYCEPDGRERIVYLTSRGLALRKRWLATMREKIISSRRRAQKRAAA